MCVLIMPITDLKQNTNSPLQGWAFFSALALLVQLGAVFTITRTNPMFCKLNVQTRIDPHTQTKKGRASLAIT